MNTEERFPMPLGKVMFSIRAIRRLRPDPIPEADLRDILTAASQAPSGGNRQPWHFLVVQNPEQRAWLGKLYREAWWAKRRDAGILGPEDIPETHRIARSAMRLADEIGDGPVIVLVCALAAGAAPMASVIPATQNLLLAARALGIGGTITTLHPVVDDRMHMLFGIPDTAQIVYCVQLGYARGRFGRLRRQPVQAVTSMDRWGAVPAWD